MAPVIAIDGPGGSGKGTIARRVAAVLGLHLLDSGALYRALALSALEGGVSLDDDAALEALAGGLDVAFAPGAPDEPSRVLLGGVDVDEALRGEACAEAASAVAVRPRVRAALLEIQRRYRRPPGLVADGRDMGTVVFPDAALKVFLTASVAERAARRHKQLIAKGIDATLDSLSADIATRDRRDRERPVAPLQPAVDAWVLDTTGVDVEVVVAEVVERAAARGIS